MTIAEMRNITAADIREAIGQAGIKKGDLVYVASALTTLGMIKQPVETAYEAVLEAIGPEGTVIMPAFNNDFCAGKDFSVEETPSEVGVLTEFFRKQPGVYRTSDCPSHTVCIRGRLAEELAGTFSPSCFGAHSIFQKIHDLDGKVLLLGCSFHEGAVHYHWMEELHEVPYRYWKKFNGNLTRNGETKRHSFFMYVRDRKALVDASGMGRDAESAGLVSTVKLGIFNVSAFEVKALKKHFDPIFEKDPYYLLKNKEEFQIKKDSPIIRVDHIALCTRHQAKIRKFLSHADVSLAYEGDISEIAAHVEYFKGLNVDIEFVEPTAEESRLHNHYMHHANTPLHHIAFEVRDLDEAVEYFKARGYAMIDGEIYLAPKPFHRVIFMSPLFTGGLLVELVADDGIKKIYNKK